MGKERASVPARSPGNDQAGKKPENRFVRGDSAWRWPDDSAPGAAAGRSQCISSGPVGRFTARARRLAGIVSTRESRAGPEKREFASIGSLVCLLLPGGKYREGIVAEKLRHRNAPPGRCDLQLIIDEGVVESGVRGIGSGCGIENSRGARPVNRAEAHGARLARGIEIAAAELKIGENAAGSANGHDFRVRRRIVRKSDAVRPFGNDAVFFDYQGGKRPAAARADIVQRQRDGTLHEVWGHDV